MGILKRLKQFKTKPYFLVIGAGRGGTSLLAAMLDYHSQLEVGFERFSFDYLLGQKLPPSRASEIGLRVGEFKKACQREANLSKRYWGNKITTEQVAALGGCKQAGWPAYLHQFAEKVIGQRKVVFIVRDGRACVNSKIKRTGQAYETALERWKTSIAILEFLQGRGTKMLLCRYEDLLENPEAELSAICKFLGKRFEAEMLKGPANPKMPEMYRGSHLRKEESKSWPPQWTDDMGPELLKLGYLDGD